MYTRIMISGALTILLSMGWEMARCQLADPLLFPKDKYTVETKTVKTSGGEKKVTYHSYMHIPYVAKPVDKDYESMNVSVPVIIDSVAVDATNAPILLTNGVGGYMSSNNMRVGFGGPPPGGGMGRQPGGPGGPGNSMGGGPGGTGGPGGQENGKPPMTGGPGGGGPGRNSKVSGNADLALA